jgi:rhodanese-related sulfurtransferase
MEQYTEFVMNHPYLFGALGIILYMLITNLLSTVISGVKQVGPAEVVRMINRENAVVIDVRDKPSFTKGHIVDSVHVSAADVPNRIKELEAYRGRPIIVCCNDGLGSADAARPLVKAGFDKVFRLAGGIGEWRNSNFPLAKG